MVFNVDYHTQIVSTAFRLNNKDFNLDMDGAQVSSFFKECWKMIGRSRGYACIVYCWWLWYSKPFSSAPDLGNHL